MENYFFAIYKNCNLDRMGNQVENIAITFKPSYEIEIPKIEEY